MAYSHKRYSCSGSSAVTAASAGVAIATLWNPSTSRRIFLQEAHVFKTGAGATDIPVIRRITARGTATTTVTPTIVNDHERDIAPPSGALLDLAWSAQPTFEALEMMGMVTPGAIGSGWMAVFDSIIEIPAGNGIAIATGSALAMPISRVNFGWLE